MSRARRLAIYRSLAIQLIVVAVFAASYGVASRKSRQMLHRVVSGRLPSPVVPIESRRPREIVPLYDDPGVVSDEELAAVLKRLQPRFPRKRLSPNVVEHALRTWGLEASFDDPDVLSGSELRDFLLDHRRFIRSWGRDIRPLLEPGPLGIAVRWGREDGASMHHDHLLACLSEAGVGLDQPVVPPTGQPATLNSLLQQALWDMRLEQSEIEWSVMAFALWLPSGRTWTTAEGRLMSFDLLARRLMQGHRRFGTCLGTHRLYSLMLLLRVDEMVRGRGGQAGGGLLSEAVGQQVYLYLAEVRDLITASQFPDGHWPSNWYDGADALISPRDDQEFEKAIATGHHLEWLAIAPPELHPPREQIRRAADWVIGSTLQQSEDRFVHMYTYYSHVGNALALWRKTRPFDFWRRWRQMAPLEKKE